MIGSKYDDRSQLEVLVKTARFNPRTKRRKGRIAKLGIKPHILVLFCIVVVALSIVVISRNLAMEEQQKGPPRVMADATKLSQ
jgi:hypothetical protein